LSMPCEALSREISSSILHLYALTFNTTVYVSHIRQFWSTARIETTEEGTKILATVDGILRTVTESSLRRNLKLQDEEGITSHTTYSLPILPPVPTPPILTVTPSETTPIRQYTRRARIAQSFALSPVADKHASPLRDFSQGEACPTDFGFIVDQDRANITKQHSKMIAKLEAQEVEINRVATSSDVVPTASLIFATATESTQYTRRKGKETMVESETLKKQKLQEQIDAQVTRELEEQMAKEDQRKSEQIARDAEIARIHAEEELQTMIDTLDKKRFKRKGTRFEQESTKKLKTSEEVSEEVKSPDEVPKEKVKEMMQLVPIEEVYVEALQVKHLIIDWKVHTEGKRSYWKITRLGGSSASYQFFINMLKHLDREDLNQLWRIVKESLSNRPPTSDKEMELWVDAKQLYDSCVVHHVTSRDKEIFMLVEKDYPFRKGLAIVMISYKLQVKNYSRMANDLILKIFKIASTPRQQGKVSHDYS
nr:hypothetical protein [Tanacetum cinerariifolium]